MQNVSILCIVFDLITALNVLFFSVSLPFLSLYTPDND